MTKGQRAVLEALQGESGFLAAQDIHARLRGQGSPVGLTSVYRAAQALRDSGEIDEARLPSGELGYRLCDTTKHHHHLICTVCGATVEIEAASVERWIASVATQHGYAPTAHTIEILGTCRLHS
ncbi:MAG: Fur family transcriptional regulator, ferric uptake regulator [Frankiales bacterium]|jgi:Fur family ferric uptake transcriptional regulator|nr:Fur family transcriptional regulator, ferric uptake regulator [Frankiales bacterium]